MGLALKHNNRRMARRFIAGETQPEALATIYKLRQQQCAFTLDLLGEATLTEGATAFFKRGDTNLTTHGIIHLSWPVADHVIPWNLGGKTNLSNLISSCASCNYGKDGYTIEQLGISNPFNRVPIIDKWDGLVSKIPKLKSL